MLLTYVLLAACGTPFPQVPTATPTPSPTKAATPAPTDTPAPEPTVGAFTDNIAYAGTSSQLQTLSVHLPTNAAPPYPTVVLYHGGSFLVGSREHLAPIALALSGRGFAAVSVGYTRPRG